jgi:hypothetical protein
MQRLLVLGIAACVLSLMPSVSASAMTILKQNAGITDANGDVIRVHGHRGGRGHHYGWGRGRGAAVVVITTVGPEAVIAVGRI